MKSNISLFFLLSVFFMFNSGQALAVDARTVQSEIDKAGANWIAGETSMSGLSKDDLAKYCNLEIHISQNITPGDDGFALPDNMPAHLDWSDMNGENFMTSVKDQHPCGTCATFSSLAAVEGLIKIAMDNSFIEPNLSEQHTFSCEGPLPYTFFHPMIYLKNHGAPDEDCYPYNCDYFGHRPACVDTCSDWENRVFKIDGYTFMMFPSPDKIKAALQDGPIVGGFQVFEDFQYYTGGVYEHVTGGILGGHGVAVVGYDDEGEYWICKNSWSENWGEKGYFRIKWGSGLLGFGYQSVDIHVDPQALCQNNTGPSIDALVSVNDGDFLEKEDDLEISFAYFDPEANLAGGELWYAIDQQKEIRYETPLTKLTGTDFSKNSPATFIIPGPFEPGEHAISIFVNDLCLESSNELSLSFFAGEPETDDDDDADDDDKDYENNDKDSAKSDDDGCGC